LNDFFRFNDKLLLLLLLLQALMPVPPEGAGWLLMSGLGGRREGVMGRWRKVIYQSSYISGWGPAHTRFKKGS